MDQAKSSAVDPDAIRDAVRQKYGSAAQLVMASQPAVSCCCSGPDPSKDPITSMLYSEAEQGELPEAAVLASLGCGNPTALAGLAEGEIVLDLGSGGGIDVLLSARRVGAAGFAYGLDMTDEMLEVAERNRREAGVENASFLKGHIEAIPLPDESVNVVISNCVINLSADKDQVLREAFRVLKPGGRLAVSDVVTEPGIPPAIRQCMEAYVGCVAGALERDDYIARLHAAGFAEASIETVRKYSIGALEESWLPQGLVGTSPEEREKLDGLIFSGFIRAVKGGAQ